MTSSLFMAFALGFLIARAYYTFFPKDWGSWGWSKHPWWVAYHKLCCKLCPRKHHCEEWAKRRDDV